LIPPIIVQIVNKLRLGMPTVAKLLMKDTKFLCQERTRNNARGLIIALGSVSFGPIIQ